MIGRQSLKQIQALLKWKSDHPDPLFMYFVLVFCSRSNYYDPPLEWTSGSRTTADFEVTQGVWWGIWTLSVLCAPLHSSLNTEQNIQSSFPQSINSLSPGHWLQWYKTAGISGQGDRKNRIPPNIASGNLAVLKITWKVRLYVKSI